jgi:hypothetical protein
MIAKESLKISTQEQYGIKRNIILSNVSHFDEIQWKTKC